MVGGEVWPTGWRRHLLKCCQPVLVSRELCPGMLVELSGKLPTGCCCNALGGHHWVSLALLANTCPRSKSGRALQDQMQKPLAPPVSSNSLCWPSLASCHLARTHVHRGQLQDYQMWPKGVNLELRDSKWITGMRGV